MNTKLKDLTELDGQVKVLAKILRSDYKKKYSEERFFAVTSTTSYKNGICSLSCYPKTVIDDVLNDYNFKGFARKYGVIFETKFIEKSKSYKINISIKDDENVTNN